jgi:hypothetical protein
MFQPVASPPSFRLRLHAEPRYFVLESRLATVHCGCISGAKEVESLRYPPRFLEKSITRGVSRRFERQD